MTSARMHEECLLIGTRISVSMLMTQPGPGLIGSVKRTVFLEVRCLAVMQPSRGCISPTYLSLNALPRGLDLIALHFAGRASDEPQVSPFLCLLEEVCREEGDNFSELIR